MHCHGWTANDGGLCVGCWSQITWIAAPVCERLGTPLRAGEDKGAWSAAAIADPPPFDRCRVAAHYTGVMRALIHQFKFSDQENHAKDMARWMLRAGSDLLVDAPFVLPVPLHRRRLWSRRYNQAACLAAAIASLTGCDYDPTLLRRIKKTRQQVGLTAHARRQNVGGAFSIEPHKRALLEGRRVLLVDDVITTGSTVRSAARALLRSGASGVDVLALAQVVGPSEDLPLSQGPKEITFGS